MVFVFVFVIVVFVIVFHCDSPVRCALWRRPAGRWHRFPGRKGTEHDTRAEPARPWNWQQHCQKQAEHCILMMSRVISMLLMIIMRLWWWWGRRWRRWWWWLWDNDDGDDEDGVDAAADDDYEMTMMIMMMATSPDWDGAWCNGHRHRLPIFSTHLLINISDLHYHFSLTMYILWYGLHTDSTFNLL